MDAVDHFDCSFARRAAETHEFDGEKAAAHSHDEFAGASRRRSADCWIDIEAMPDDGRITHTARQLVRRAARRTGASHRAGAIDAQRTDGVVVLPARLGVEQSSVACGSTINWTQTKQRTIAALVDRRGLCVPSFPCGLGFEREQLFLRE